MSDNPVHRVTALVMLALEQERLVQQAEIALALAKANYLRTTTEDLPELMSELTLQDVKLEDGTRVEIKPDVMCGITEANRPAAHAWLKAHSFGGLIKSVLSISFGTGDEELCRAVFDAATAELEGTAIVPEVKESVHAATLKSFCKEQLAEGAAPPQQLFGLFPFNRAVVKPPAAPKAQKTK